MTAQNTTARKSDRQIQRQQLQKLAIAAGMKLSTGLPIVVGSDKCPPIAKIKAAIGFSGNRMTRAQFSDAQDDYGATRPYLEATTEYASEEVDAILNDWSGRTDVSGEMTLREFLQISC